MKPKIFLSAIGALTLLAVLSALAFSHRRSPAAERAAVIQTFEVLGRVRSLDPANKTVRIAHEEIPDYMPAMTMPFTVRDTALLKGLTTGDRVKFELTVDLEDSWISRIEKVASDTTGEPEIITPALSYQDRETERVQAGEPVPDFSLIDQNGRAFKLSDFRGKAVLLTFIYTRCPLPNFCPLLSKNFADLQQRLAKAFPGRCALLSVTMDFQFDRPEVLKEYAARYGADEKCWTFGTGTEEQINFVADLFGLFHEPENGLISHDLRTALIGPDGRFVHLWKSNVWTPYEVQRAVGETLTGAKD